MSLAQTTVRRGESCIRPIVVAISIGISLVLDEHKVRPYGGRRR